MLTRKLCFIPFVAATLLACGGTKVPSSAAGLDAGRDGPSTTGSCDPIVFPGDGGYPSWATGSCTDAGCGPGMTCISEILISQPYQRGCVPTSCGCMACGSLLCLDAGDGLTCKAPIESRRAVKRDIDYVDEAQRSALADQALDIRLARYRYKNEPDSARRRLGFIIDDQPDPSPAVDSDREHVDEYGYTSLLLAAVQQQAAEIRALKERVDALERGEAPAAGSPSSSATSCTTR